MTFNDEITFLSQYLNHEQLIDYILFKKKMQNSKTLQVDKDITIAAHTPTVLCMEKFISIMDGEQKDNASGFGVYNVFYL